MPADGINLALDSWAVRLGDSLATFMETITAVALDCEWGAASLEQRQVRCPISRRDEGRRFTGRQLQLRVRRAVAASCLANSNRRRRQGSRPHSAPNDRPQNLLLVRSGQLAIGGLSSRQGRTRPFFKLEKEGSGHTIAIPVNRIAAMFPTGPRDPLTVQLNGQLQWLTVKQEWRFVAESLHSDKE